MNLFKHKKTIYLMFLGIVVLLGIVVRTTYAKFPSAFITENEVVKINLGFDISIIDVQEYEEFIIEPFEITEFNVQVTNNSSVTAYYGIWYDMIEPNVLPSDGSIEVGRISGTTGPTSGSLEAGKSSTASVSIVNNTADRIKVYLGINSSITSTTDIEYLDGKYLITDEVAALGLKDISITYVTIDGSKSETLPTSGNYTMDYVCRKGSTLEWNTFTKTLTYGTGAKVGDKCTLNFTSSTHYPLLSEMPVGSYVKYVGTGGKAAGTAVACQKGGSASNGTATNATISPNSCLGQNAREDLDTSGYTYGYCYSANYKYTTTGWRLAYVKDEKPVIISAGAPECLARTASNNNTTFITTADMRALKYCNADLVDGDCSCPGTNTTCTTASSDAWAMDDEDFYYITKAINNGIGKRLTSASSSLGDIGGSLGNTLYCNGAFAADCGYSNDLIDIGGHYSFASPDTSNNGIFWFADTRNITTSTATNAYGIRPVISLSASVYVTGGAGTIDDPYTITKIAEGKEYEKILDNSVKPNAPNLETGLIPVYYDYNEEVWKKADSTNANNSWYNYSDKRWANAVMISNETLRSTYVSATVGTPIADADITAFYVWIPRFKYRVWNINRQASYEMNYAYPAYSYGVEIEFETGTASTGNVTCSYDITARADASTLVDKCIYNGTEITPTSVNSDYTDAVYTHPAFTFGGSGITGFWVGKFETSGSATAPTIVPDAVSLKSQTVSVQFTTAKVFQGYGLTNLDAHMLTNLEWGAVAYLSHSVFGICDGVTKCRETYVNNSSSYYTGRSAGVIAASSAKVANGTYDYKGAMVDGTTTVKDESKVASTTGNITGVYDLSGGSIEYVMGVMYNNSNAYQAGSAGSSWNGSTTIAEKYYNSYAYGTVNNTQIAYNRARLGDATAEVTTNVGSNYNAWRPGYSVIGASSTFNYSSSSNFWHSRSGYAGELTYAGIFHYYFKNGGSNGAIGFRSSIS